MECCEGDDSFSSLPLASDESLSICSGDYFDDTVDTLSIASTDDDILSTSQEIRPPLCSSTPLKPNSFGKAKKERKPVESNNRVTSPAISLANTTSNTSQSTSSSSASNTTGSEPDSHKWTLGSVLALNGCGENCALKIHLLNEHSILSAHHQFLNKTTQEQNNWIIEYFNSNCPCDPSGTRDIRNVEYTIHGRKVCLGVWLQVLSLSLSRFYRLRAGFVDNDGPVIPLSRQKSPCVKTSKSIAWMKQYFDKIGDKRPDKTVSIYQHV